MVIERVAAGFDTGQPLRAPVPISATHRADTPLGGAEAQAALASLHRVAGRLDRLVAALRQAV